MGPIIILAVMLIVISVFWTNGIVKMHEEHPDYDGMDFLNEETDQTEPNN